MRNSSLIFASVALGVFTAHALADPVLNPVTATLYSDTSVGLNPGSNSLTVTFNNQSVAPAFVGQINWFNATSDWHPHNDVLQSILGSKTINNVTYDATFSSFCIDGLQDVYFGHAETWNFGVVPLTQAPAPGTPMTADRAAQITEFWNRFYPLVGTNNVNGTAFQLGVWEIIGDGATGSLSTGNFQASNDTIGAIALATSWLGQMDVNHPNSKISYTTTYTVYALADNGIQDQIFGVQGAGGSQPVPLPAIFPMGASLLGAAGTIRLLRRRRPT